MISKKLQDARNYEAEKRPTISMEDRPFFHATGQVGWINDPNGFSRYKGQYHLFYQYYPFDTHWGPMHWGHSVSEDLIKWEFLPCAIAPDMEYDKDGCFSGSAIELEDGRQLLMYTSVIRKEEADGTMKDYQQQCVAIGDGVDYEKVSQNPVIPTSMIPEGNDLHDFRDPKIIKNGDKYYCFAINRHADGSGQILVYESADAISWSFTKVLDRSANKVGRIWECPDYFPLGDKKVLIVSPQEVEGYGEDVYPGFNNFFLVGEGEEFLDFNRKTVQPIDFGTDFYAAQTIETEDERRVMIAWMQNWETCNYGNDKHDYYGMMTLPRELTMDGLYVLQNPIKEIENYYENEVSYNKVRVSDEECRLDGIDGRVFDMTIDVTPMISNDNYDFTIRLAKNEEHETRITFDSKKGKIKLDRSNSGVRISALDKREFSVDKNNGKLELRIVLDKYALEIFVNGGRQTAAMKIDTELTAKDIVFESTAPVSMNITKHEFKEGLF